MKSILGILALFIIISCASWSVPQSLVGKWIQNSEVTFRSKVNGRYHFEKIHTNINISIHPDGSVSGTIGEAKLTECKIIKNRGDLGRALNVKTDYRIIGQLQGKMGANDKTELRKLSIPFNLEEDALKGSCFEGGGFDIFPFSDFYMKRDTH